LCYVHFFRFTDEQPESIKKVSTRKFLTYAHNIFIRKYLRNPFQSARSSFSTGRRYVQRHIPSNHHAQVARVTISVSSMQCDSVCRSTARDEAFRQSFKAPLSHHERVQYRTSPSASDRQLYACMYAMPGMLVGSLLCTSHLCSTGNPNLGQKISQVLLWRENPWRSSDTEPMG
jgi:hypothetical protein